MWFSTGPALFILAVVLLLFGAALQGAVGFGLGLFVTPLLVWAGMPLPQVLALVVTAAYCQSAWSAYRYREHIDWGAVFQLNGVRLIAIPAGLLLLELTVESGPARAKQAVGGALLLVLAAQWAFRVRPRPALHGGWLGVAGLASGVLTGWVGMGGPPVVLWVMAHDWPNERLRSLLWGIVTTIGPLVVGLWVWRFGAVALEGAVLGLCAAPFVLLGTTMGLSLGLRLSTERLRLATGILLALIGVSSIVGPMLRM